MPLMQGKSPKAFSKNVATEMHHDKPQKQALAIAYAIKRRAQAKKMAGGGNVNPPPKPKEDTTNPSLGQVLDSDKQKKVAQSMKNAFGMAEGGIVADSSKQKGIPPSYPFDEDKIPMEDHAREHDPMHGEQFDSSEDLHPMEEPEHGAEDAVYEQYELSHEEESHGQLPHPKEPYSPYHSGNPVHKADKIAQRKMPLAEQQAYLAHGGEVDATKRTLGTHYPGNPVHKYAPNGMYSQSKFPLSEQEAYLAKGGSVEGLRENPYYAPEEEGEHFAMGGMHGMHPKSIAHGIMMKKMAKGGPVESENWTDRPEDGDSIDNFHHEDHPDNDYLSDEEDTHYFQPNQADLREPDAKLRRKSMLDGIMRNLQKRHYGT